MPRRTGVEERTMDDGRGYSVDGVREEAWRRELECSAKEFRADEMWQKLSTTLG